MRWILSLLSVNPTANNSLNVKTGIKAGSVKSCNGGLIDYPY